MRYRVVVTAEAGRNTDEIFDWLAERSPQGAAAWFTAFLAAVDSLETDPDRHPFAPESTRFSQPVRQLLFKTPRGRRYRILFTTDAATVAILYVRGPGQSPVNE